jgi:diaminopimelate decarboxylase
VNEFFPYEGGELAAEAVPIARIAAAVGTPFYLYSAAALAARYRALANAFAPAAPLICFAVKANPNLAVLRIFATLGAGADVVSEGELRRALAAGFAPARIVFSGVGKTDADLSAALDAGIRQINVESVPELQRLSEIAAAAGVSARIAIRVNPDVDALTHPKIATGKKENKFGIDIADALAAYRLAARLPALEPVGLAVHIGSQLTDLAPFRAAFEVLAELTMRLRGEGLSVKHLDLGGGLGIRYHREIPPAPATYAALVRDIFGPHGVELAVEPGRFLCGPAGVLVTRVVYVKDSAVRRVVVVDSGMNDLVRPAMYEAWHDIVPVRRPAPDAALAAADVVGPVCETGDTFARARRLPPLAAGDLVALADAGAYGAAMSSTYNSRPLIPEVMVADRRFAVIRRRPSYDEMTALEAVPEWLGEPTGMPLIGDAA